MVKKLLVDASHREQIRIVVLENGKVIEYDGETANKQQIKGNIYLAKVTRIEPSLQAAFVEYGGKKHGFLPFSEIHPDYYNIPVADKQRLLASVMPQDDGDDGADDDPAPEDDDDSAYPEEEERVAAPEEAILPVETAHAQAGGKRRRRRRTRSSAHETAANAEFGEGDAGEASDTWSHGGGESPFDEERPYEGEAHSEGGEGDVDARYEHVPSYEAHESYEHEQGDAHEADESAEGEDAGARPPARRRIASAMKPGRRPHGGKHGGSRSGGDEDAPDEEDSIGGSAMRRSNVYKKYKIQDVVRRGQILLIQVEKEERGHKGASVTTFVSLAGKYCVLMPNALKKGGVSRKVTNGEHRKQLKAIMATLDIKPGMGVIVRTAGAGKTREQIFSDYDYLAELWNSIRRATLSSDAPAFIHAEEDAVRRAIRDLYDDDFEEALIEGRPAYESARQFIATMMPEHKERVKLYEGTAPLFNRYRVEEQINALYEHTAPLDSGGSIVISPTEALISIDVNSGKSTSQRDVEETALTTNLEAAYEIARQLKLRDLSGLIVIDFIDMLEYKNRKSVERALKDAFSDDRARVQLGRISNFGLLEMSRQRLRPSLMEMTANPCPICRGTGLVKSAGAVAVQALRAIEHECTRTGAKAIKITLHTDVAAYIFNYKREQIDRIETTYGAKLLMVPVSGDRFGKNQYSLQRIRFIKEEEEVRSATELLAGHEDMPDELSHYPDDREERDGESEGKRFKRILRAQERESRGTQGRAEGKEGGAHEQDRREQPEQPQERRDRRRDEPRAAQRAESGEEREGGQPQHQHGRERLRRGGTADERRRVQAEGGRARHEGQGRQGERTTTDREERFAEAERPRLGLDSANERSEAPRGFPRIMEGLLRKITAFELDGPRR